MISPRPNEGEAKEHIMSQAQDTAERNITVWNEADPARRKALLTAAWTSDATYVDPIMKGEGVDEISALIGGVHERFAGFRFELLGVPDGHSGYVRFSW